MPRFGFENGAKNDLYYIDTPDFYDTKTPLGSIPIQYTKTASANPKMFTDTEAAARFSFFLPGIDFSVSGFYGWDKNPRFVKSGYAKLNAMNLPEQFFITINQEYYRIKMIGIDAAIPAGEVTIRLETAWVGDRYFEPKNQNPIQGVPGSGAIPLTFNPALQKHQLLMLAGIDWIKSSWTLSAQYF